MLPPFRGTGLARALCEAAHAAARANGLKEVTADSQVSIVINRHEHAKGDKNGMLMSGARA